MNCPFCNDTDFDRMGLYLHISNDHCPIIPSIKDDYRREIESYIKTAGDGNPQTPTTTEKEE